MATIAISTDAALTLSALTDAVSQAVVNSATVTAQLTDAVTSGNIGSAVTLTTTGSGGNYAGLLPNATTSLLSVGQAVVLTTVATYSGMKFTDKQLLIAAYPSS